MDGVHAGLCGLCAGSQLAGKPCPSAFASLVCVHWGDGVQQLLEVLGRVCLTERFFYMSLKKRSVVLSFLYPCWRVCEDDLMICLCVCVYKIYIYKIYIYFLIKMRKATRKKPHPASHSSPVFQPWSLHYLHVFPFPSLDCFPLPPLSFPFPSFFVY